MTAKKIVSVQDISCYGQCSLTVAQPVLSAYGFETAILPSAILSTHTGGFTGFTVLDLTDEMPKIVDHWRKEKITFDAIYTGYIGDTRQFALIKDMRDMLNPGGLLICDPAMADHGKLYVALNENIVAGMRELVRESDIIMPNITEACFLLDIPYNERPGREEIDRMLKGLADMGPETVIITGVSFEEGRLGAVAYTKKDGKTVEYFTTWMEKSYHGTGDIFSSVLIANLLKGKSLYDCLKDACEFIVDCIKETMPDESHVYGVKFEQVLAKR
ncbi:MAG: pyridoxamine kinase [Lachnospiraceae bacterium]|nr:pyridoxamine kinase [Lachnospiraceae bacterium]